MRTPSCLTLPRAVGRRLAAGLKLYGHLFTHIEERYEAAHRAFILQNAAKMQAERADPWKGQRPEDGSPEGRNLAAPGYGSRQPSAKGQARG